MLDFGLGDLLHQRFAISGGLVVQDRHAQFATQRQDLFLQRHAAGHGLLAVVVQRLDLLGCELEVGLVLQGQRHQLDHGDGTVAGHGFGRGQPAAQHQGQSEGGMTKGGR
ncbi:hypothetical protein D9M68_935730 [compost metagenome]